jgi:ABC-2 type transport system permease protein
MSAYTGTGQLLRLAWRRDRLLIPVTVATLTALSVGSAQATMALYPTDQAAVEGLGGILSNPAVSAMYGPVVVNRGGLSVFKTVMLGAVFLGILTHALVRRHTRVEEEDGRFELIGAGVVGRRAPLTAAVVLALLTSIVTAALSVAGLAALGLAPAGSVAFGVTWLIAGVVMTGVAALAAQLTTSARAASGLGLGTLGAMFLVRAVGDTQANAGVLSWISPLGWVGQVRPYGANRLWVLALALALLAGCLGVAFALLQRRDLGSGLLPARPGRAAAAASLRSPLALTWRVDRATILGWSVTYAVLAAVVGNLVKSIADMADQPQVAEMLRKLGGTAGSLTDIYFATELRFCAAGGAAAGIVLAVRLATEERVGRTEPLLAAAVSRPRLYVARLLLALALPTLLMTVVGLVAGLVAAAADVAGPSPLELTLAAWATLPAVWLLIGVGFAAYGLGQRWTAPVGWAALTVALVLGEFGPLLELPGWLVGLSPLDHLSQLPGGSFAAGPAIAMTVLAAVLAAGGAAAFRSRDIG